MVLAAITDRITTLGIPKGTPVGYTPLVMQRREDLYPPASANFPPVWQYSPERWDKWTPKPWTYIPFNGGPRICVGQQFALTEMGTCSSSPFIIYERSCGLMAFIGYTIVRILQRFESISKYWNDDGPQFKCKVVMSPSDGVNVGFWKAKIG